MKGEHFMSGKLNLTTESFDKEVQAMTSRIPDVPWENPVAYAEWLAQTYFLVRHTTRFVALAAGRTAVEDRETHYAMVHHLKEEANHDLVALRDIKALDDSIENHVEFPETRLIRNNQYYWIENGHPMALNGYALLLEGLSVKMGPAILERLKNSPNKDATAFLKLHVEVDQDHYADGLEHLVKAPEPIMRQIFANLEESSLLYIRMLERCIETAKKAGKTLPQGAGKNAGRKAA